MYTSIIVAVLLISQVYLVSSQPTHLYAFSGLNQQTFTTIDLIHQNSTDISVPSNFYLLGTLAANATDMSILVDDWPNTGKDQDVIYSFNYHTHKFTNIAHVNLDLASTNVDQPYGYDTKENKAFVVGVMYGNITIYSYMFNKRNAEYIWLPIPVAKSSPMPVGAFDETSGLYYFITIDKEGIHLYAFDTWTTHKIVQDTLFPGVTLVNPQLIVSNGIVYFADTPLSGSQYTLYQVNVQNRLIKAVFQMPCEFGTYKVFPYAQAGDNIVFLTSPNNGTSMTYTTVDLTSLAHTQFTSDTAIMPNNTLFISSVDLRLLGAIWRLPDVGNQRVLVLANTMADQVKSYYTLMAGLSQEDWAQTEDGKYYLWYGDYFGKLAELHHQGLISIKPVDPNEPLPAIDNGQEN
eukprot:gene2450-2786_t